MIRRLEHLYYEQRLRDLGSGDTLQQPSSTWRGPYKKGGEGLLTRACSARTRGNGFKLKESRFRLDIRKKFFTMRVVRHWNRLPREAGSVQGQVGRGFEQPGLAGGVPAHGRGVELADLSGLFQPKPFYDSIPSICPECFLCNNLFDVCSLFWHLHRYIKTSCN